MNPTLAAHAAAILTILIWGATFTSTKVLLQAFAPIEILFLRFLLGACALLLACPRLLHVRDRRREVTFALAGLCGVTLYFLLENIALSHSTASNVGVLVGISPFLTALLARHRPGREPASRLFRGLRLRHVRHRLHRRQQQCRAPAQPAGRCPGPAGGPDLGLLFHPDPQDRRLRLQYLAGDAPHLLLGPALHAAHPAAVRLPLGAGASGAAEMLANLLFLGLGASALCFATWNFTIRILGAIKTSVYIYAVPVVSVITATLLLGERLTGLALTGMALIILGLVISEGRLPLRRKKA